VLFALGWAHIGLDATQIEMLHQLHPGELHQSLIINGPQCPKSSAALEFFLASGGCRDNHALLAAKSRRVLPLPD